MNQNPYRQPTDGPLFGLIKFLAIVGLLTIFVAGISLGYLVASGGW